MRKGKYYIGMFLAAALLFSGCQSKGENAENEVTATPGLEQDGGNTGEQGGEAGKNRAEGQGNENSQGKGENTPEKGEGTNTPATEMDNKDSAENKEDGGGSKASQKITDSGITEDKIKHPVTLKDGKAWGELPVVGEEDAVYCNRQENIKETENLLLLCPDPRYGMTYYVNYGADYYIYAVKDGVSELAVEIPAKRLFFREGKLYFMVETYGEYALEGLENGDILSYDPIGGKVSVVVAGIGTMKPQETSVTRGGSTAEVPEEIAVADTSMTVYQDGIYYVQTGKTIDIGTQYIWDAKNKYYYSFETGETQMLKDTSPLPSLTFVRWGGSFVSWESDGYEGKDLGEMYQARTGQMLVDSQMQKQRSLGFNCSPYFYLVGDKAYTTQTQWVETAFGYSDDGATADIISYDMETGEEARYPVSRAEDSYELAPFVWDGRMYFGDLLSYSFAEKKESLAYCNLIEPNNLKAKVVSEYYTDGEGLYALCALDGRMYRIERREEPYTLSLPVGDIVYDDKFEFLPIGE